MHVCPQSMQLCQAFLKVMSTYEVLCCRDLHPHLQVICTMQLLRVMHAFVFRQFSIPFNTSSLLGLWVRIRLLSIWFSFCSILWEFNQILIFLSFIGTNSLCKIILSPQISNLQIT